MRGALRFPPDAYPSTSSFLITTAERGLNAHRNEAGRGRRRRRGAHRHRPDHCSDHAYFGPVAYEEAVEQNERGPVAFDSLADDSIGNIDHYRLQMVEQTRYGYVAVDGY